jgi:hypothetical protein
MTAGRRKAKRGSEPRAKGASGSRESPGRLLVAGPVRILLDQRIASIHGTPMRLTRTVFDLLVYLVVARGRSVDESEILEQVIRSFHGRDTSLVRHTTFGSSAGRSAPIMRLSITSPHVLIGSLRLLHLPRIQASLEPVTIEKAQMWRDRPHRHSEPSRHPDLRAGCVCRRRQTTRCTRPITEAGTKGPPKHSTTKADGNSRSDSTFSNTSQIPMIGPSSGQTSSAHAPFNRT